MFKRWSKRAGPRAKNLKTALIILLASAQSALAEPPAATSPPAAEVDAHGAAREQNSAPNTAEQASEQAPATAAPASVPAPAADAAALRQKLARVLDELIKAKSRVSNLSQTLFKTPVVISLIRKVEDQRLSHLTLRLDGLAVHDSAGQGIDDRATELFRGFLTPGAHELGVEVAEAATANSEYRYVRSERFQVLVKKDTRTTIEIVLFDDSDMAEELPDDDEGTYDVRTRVRVEREEIGRN